MGGISNNFASNPELSRGVSKLYSQVREDMKKNGGRLRGGFEGTFTSADGLVTVSLSSEALKAYGGNSDDVGLHMKVLTRGPDASTSESNAMSDPIHGMDDVAANESDMQQNMGKTQIIDDRGMDIGSQPQPDHDLAGKAARLFSAVSDGVPSARQQSAPTASNRSIADVLKARSEDGARLADHLMTFLDDSRSPEKRTDKAQRHPVDVKA